MTPDEVGRFLAAHADVPRALSEAIARTHSDAEGDNS